MLYINYIWIFKNKYEKKRRVKKKKEFSLGLNSTFWTGTIFFKQPTAILPQYLLTEYTAEKKYYMYVYYIRKFKGTKTFPLYRGGKSQYW